jgi:ppGpp synthetase/RelA/SpoT-type nucleotidyltranferase
MPPPELLRAQFSRYEGLLSELQLYVRESLRTYCDEHHFPFLDRLKSVESLSEKLESGRFKSWEALDDLYACTVVVPVESQCDAVVEALSERFEEVRSRGRHSVPKAPEVFRYDGLRWYGKIRPEVAAVRQPGLGDIVFEVQVLTVFEHAWTTVSHALVYKSDDADWRRDRLSAQLKAAVEQAEMIIAAFEGASASMPSSQWPELECRQSVIDTFMQLDRENHVPVTLVPESWRRFADNVYALVGSYERSRGKVPAAVYRLIEVIKADFERDTPYELPVSGSLFQYVVSVVNRPGTDGNLDSFPVVHSSELVSLYGVESVRRPFEFGRLGDDSAEGGPVPP